MDILFSKNMPIAEFEKASDDVLQNFFPTRVDFSDTVQAARNELKSLILENNFEFFKVKESLRTKEGDTDRIEIFLDKLTKRKVLLLYSVLIEHNTPYGECVKEFDWVLKMITGTDGLKSTRKPIVQLQLTTLDASGIFRKNVYDMKKDVLTKFMMLLENVSFGKK